MRVLDLNMKDVCCMVLLFQAMRAFRKDLHACGYITHVYTANAADFAIPQSRRNVWEICS